VVVSAYRHRRRKEYTCGVEGLEYTLQIALTSDFFDQDRGEALGAQFLVDA